MTGITGTGSTILNKGLQTKDIGVRESVVVNGDHVTVKAQQNETILDEYRNQGVDLELSGEQPEGKFTEEELAQMREEEQNDTLRKMYQEQAEAAKENAEALGEELQDMARALEIARRISNGDHVPASDEKFLMDFNKDIYLGAKSMQAIAKNEDPKDYKSILEEEEEEGSGVEITDGEIVIDASGLNLCHTD